jgi:hypothetical protein
MNPSQITSTLIADAFKAITPEPPSVVDVPAAKVTQINIDDIKPNTILIINIAVDSPEQKMAVAPVFGKLLAPFAKKLKEKGVTVMLMALNESITQISETEMNVAGWEKKEKSLIIKPFDKK